MSVRTRNSLGQWLPGVAGNPQGRLPRQTETAYLETTMREVTVERWAEIIQLALDDALGENPHTRARAREWLAKYVIGEPSQLHQLLYKEERKFEIVVTFGDNGQETLGDVIDGVVVGDASRD